MTSHDEYIKLGSFDHTKSTDRTYSVIAKWLETVGIFIEYNEDGPYVPVWVEIVRNCHTSVEGCKNPAFRRAVEDVEFRNAALTVIALGGRQAFGEFLFEQVKLDETDQG